MLEKGDTPLPQDVILHELGTTLEQLSRPQEAIQSYQRILDEFPQSPYRRRPSRRWPPSIRRASPAGRRRLPGGMPAGFPG